MPSIRVTIKNNARQTQQAVVLVPSSIPFDPSTPSSCRNLVLEQAKKKFQSKKASRVFSDKGRELLTTDDWQRAVQNDAVLLVSKQDEGYVGSIGKSGNGQTADQSDAVGKYCSIIRLNDKAEVDTQAFKQLEVNARSLPGIIHAVAQPDLHPGTRYSIGGVFVSKGWIHPPLIGSDIGCGMAWYKTSLSRSQVDGEKSRKIAEKLRGLEGPWRSQKEREFWLDTDASHASAGPKFDALLGTIGAGNHFAELQVVEELRSGTSEDPGQDTRMRKDDVVLLVHSGSRGYGGNILERYREHGRDSMREIDAQEYLTEHDCACRWASKNRDLIALRFLSVLEPGDPAWSLGVRGTSLSGSLEEVQTAFAGVQERRIVDIWHNNVERILWPPSGTYQEQVYIHRKGAAPVLDPQTRRPLNVLPLPGSRATPTLVLNPAFTDINEYGKSNGLSLAHGAGRARSRADAAKYIANKYGNKPEDLTGGDFVRVDKDGNKRQEESDGRSIHGGTWVICEDKQLIWEEAGEAYKNVWDVGDDLVAKGCAEILGWCRGRISYKVRKE